MHNQHKRLIRQLSGIDVFCIAAGAMISSGLFILPGLVYAKVGPAVILVYILAGILYLPTFLHCLPKLSWLQLCPELAVTTSLLSEAWAQQRVQ